MDGMELNVLINPAQLPLLLLIMMTILNAELISVINVLFLSLDKDV